MSVHYAFARWLYRGGHPNRLARVMNRIQERLHSSGLIMPSRLVTLEVPGRRTGRLISFPLVLADYEGGRYLVAMVGPGSDWIRNVQAAGGRAVLRHGHREYVRLDEVLPQDRAPILRRYLAIAPGARPHVAQKPEQTPIFRVIPVEPPG